MHFAIDIPATNVTPATPVSVTVPATAARVEPTPPAAPRKPRASIGGVLLSTARSVVATMDWRSVAIMTWLTVAAFWLVPVFFAFVHVQWLTAIVWGLLIAALLVKTKSLGACIIAHGVTNFLLGAYVLYTKEWFFW